MNKRSARIEALWIAHHVLQREIEEGAWSEGNEGGPFYTLVDQSKVGKQLQKISDDLWKSYLTLGGNARRSRRNYPK